MLNNQRIDQIHKLIDQNQRISIKEISQQFKISTATARRDLDVLARESKIQRIHGGALIAHKAPPEPPILQRSEEQREEKERIGAATAALIQKSETVFLGSGSTVLEVAKRLPENRNLTIITNSMLIINTLAPRQDINLVILGGIFHPSEYSAYGHLTELMLNEIHTDKVIFGIRALDLEYGLTNDFLPEITTDRAIMKIGKEIIITADHTKFNRISTACVGPVSWIHKIVTDSQTSPDIIQSFIQQGVEVIIA
jgi:DeoR/GlpR family transcriptional regulator of sugar metabolism